MASNSLKSKRENCFKKSRRRRKKRTQISTQESIDSFMELEIIERVDRLLLRWVHLRVREFKLVTDSLILLIYS